MEDLVMARRSFCSRPRAGKPGKKSIRQDSIFPIEKGQVSSTKRDRIELENHRRRYYMTLTKNSFHTATNRVAPTIGEQEIHRYSRSTTNSQKKEEKAKGNSLRNTKSSFPGVSVFSFRREHLMEKLVPDCFDHIQNYHHYREDIDRIDNGVPVPYLTITSDVGCNTGMPFNAKQNMRVETARSFESRRQFSQSKYLQRKPRSANYQRRTGLLLETKERNILNRASLEPPKVPKHSLEETCSNSNPDQENISSVRFEDDESNRTVESEAVELYSNTTSREKTESDVDFDLCNLQAQETYEKEVNVTPESSSLCSFSGVKIVDFSCSIETSKVSAHQGNEGSIVDSRPYLSAFLPRFPHLKASDIKKKTAKRNKNSKGSALSQTMPPWMQYRVLCDALRTASPFKNEKVSKTTAKNCK